MSFFKFPTTPHLALLPGLDIRDDKVLSEVERSAVLSHEIVVEEKIDGANLGISFDKAGSLQIQNRGEFLREPLTGQWKPLQSWIQPRIDTLFDLLEDRLILFGEWLYARHSISYTRLPDLFLVFDIWDREAKRFWSTLRRDSLTRSANLFSLQNLAKGKFQLNELEKLLTTSSYGEEPMEGIYLRREDSDWLIDRAKLVRPVFIQAVEEHWSRQGIQPNQLAGHPTSMNE